MDDAGGFNTSSFPNIAIAFEGATLTVRPTEYLFVFQAKDGLGISVTTIACPAFRSDQGQGLTIIGGGRFRCYRCRPRFRAALK